jgi:Holliday junction resolvase RusA-like endonuclease
MKWSVVLTEFPPSINRLYFSLPRGGKAMTTDGRRFQSHTVSKLHDTWGPMLKGFDANKPYAVTVTVFFPSILNKGWPGKAQQRFKKRDATNLIKLLEDTLAKAIGVDDANFLSFTIRKYQDPKNPRIEVMIEDTEDQYGEAAEDQEEQEDPDHAEE